VKKTRAAAAAIIGLALTATGALAAAPHLQAPVTAAPVSTMAQDETAVGGSNDNHGGAVSTLAKGTNGTNGELDATTPEATGSPEATTPDTTEPADTQGAHGALVSAVAQDDTKVGGPNDNHGGAVSIVARGEDAPSTTLGMSATHGASATHGKSVEHRKSTDGKSRAGTHPASH